jgi:hypothetical protein
MKKITLVIAFVLYNSLCFSQDTEAPTTPTNFQFPFYSGIGGPQSLAIEWEHATDNVGVTEYEIYQNGVLRETVPYNGSDVTQAVGYSNLPNGLYCYTVVAKDAAGNASLPTPEICKNIFSTYPPNPVDIYISGYLNFSGANKAIEISNPMENLINLNAYSLKISVDGSPNWTYTYTFPSNTVLGYLYDPTYNIVLHDMPVFIVGNSGMTMCTDRVNDFNDAITNIDGNDVIGLFKNDVLIDIIGELGSSATIAQNNTFLDASSVPSSGLPNTVYDPFRWDEYPNNNSCPVTFGTFDLVALSTEEFEEEFFQLYPNPTNGNTVFFQTKNNATIDAINVYDISGKRVLQQTNISNQLNVQNLQQGIYILQLQIGNQTITKKLIKQ